MHTTGSGYQFGGVGFDLNNSTTTPESMQSQAYNASAYNGITFWAKGSGTLRVEFADAIVRADRPRRLVHQRLLERLRRQHARRSTGNWTQITIPFSSACSASRAAPAPRSTRRS